MKTDAQCAHPHGVLHRAFHGAPERDAAFKLLANAFGHQLRVKLGLADLDNVQMQLAVGHGRQLLAQLLDVGAFFADDHAGARGVHRNAALAVRAFDDHPADTGLLAFAFYEGAHFDIFKQQIAEFLAFGVPAAVPRAVDLQAHANRIDFLTH